MMISTSVARSGRTWARCFTSSSSLALPETANRAEGRQINFCSAVNEALHIAMEENPRYVEMCMRSSSCQP